MIRSHALPAARALALLRIVTGGIFLVAAFGKMTLFKVGGVLPLPVTSLHWQVELPTRLASWLAQHPDGIGAAVVRDLLLPRGALVAGIVAWAQALAGVMLVLGFRTRLAAFLAGLVSLALAIAAGWRDSADTRPYVMLLALSIAFLLGKAGETFGIDGWRRERRRDREL